MASSGSDEVLRGLREGRAHFLALVEEVRPELHRYCARMTGSVADGEDVVQDTLARACYQLAEMTELPPLRPWLFRIAHNRAIDFLRSYERRMGEPLDPDADPPGDAADQPDEAMARDDAVRAAVSRFLELAAAQRSCVILADVLEHSLEEIAAMLDLSLPATKAALHRGRARLRALSQHAPPQPARRAHPPALVQYAALFNARDWDGVRGMLIDDVKLDLVTRQKSVGTAARNYFTNYAALTDWRLVPASLDDRSVIAVFRDRGHAQPDYFIELEFLGEQVAAIRDFRYVPYIAREARFEFG